MPWTAIITAVVKGIIGPILQWWATYNQGRNAQKASDLEASLKKQQEVDDAASSVPDGDFVLGPDGRVRRRVASPPPGVPSGGKPDPK